MNKTLLRTGFVLLFALLFCAEAMAGGVPEGGGTSPSPQGGTIPAAPQSGRAGPLPTSLIDVAYSAPDGSVKVHFIDGESVEMFFQEEGRARMYTYNLKAGTGRIISRGAVSAGIYDFTIKSTEVGGIITEVFVVIPNIGAMQQVAGADPDYFPVLELELLSEDLRIERTISVEEARRISELRTREAQERERQEAAERQRLEAERLERERREAAERRRLEAERQAQTILLIELRGMRPRAEELHKLKRLNRKQFQDYQSLMAQFKQFQRETSRGPVHIPDLEQELSQMGTLLGAIETKLSKSQRKDL